METKEKRPEQADLTRRARRLDRKTLSPLGKLTLVALHRGDVRLDEPWRTSENPMEGVQVTFLETETESAGARLVMRMVVAPFANSTCLQLGRVDCQGKQSKEKSS